MIHAKGTNATDWLIKKLAVKYINDFLVSGNVFNSFIHVETVVRFAHKATNNVF